MHLLRRYEVKFKVPSQFSLQGAGSGQPLSTKQPLLGLKVENPFLGPQRPKTLKRKPLLITVAPSFIFVPLWSVGNDEQLEKPSSTNRRQEPWIWSLLRLQRSHCSLSILLLLLPFALNRTRLMSLLFSSLLLLISQDTCFGALRRELDLSQSEIMEVNGDSSLSHFARVLDS